MKIQLDTGSYLHNNLNGAFLYFFSFLTDGGGVQPLKFNSVAGLEFSIMNWTSSMSFGAENPMVSGRKMKRTPVMTIRKREMPRKLREYNDLVSNESKRSKR